jgi:hypothetical protein
VESKKIYLLSVAIAEEYTALNIDSQRTTIALNDHMPHHILPSKNLHKIKNEKSVAAQDATPPIVL